MEKYSKQLPIEQIMYGQYIKYDALRRLVELEFASSNAEEVNVFIDLYEMLLPLYKSLDMKDSSEAISSTIINYAAHMREYFKSRHRTWAKIIFVYSSNASANTTRFCAEYNAKYRNRVLNNSVMAEQISWAVERAKQIIPYLQDVFIKTGTVEPSVIIRDIIIREPMFQECPNVVISSSEYAYQLPANCPDTVVFRKKFGKSNEVTAYSYNFMNCINAFIYETRNVVVEYPLYPKLITPIMVLSGIPKRNLKSMSAIPQTLELVKHIPKECIGDILAMYACIQEIATSNKWKLMPFEEFDMRYRTISIEYQGGLYDSLPESKEWGFLNQLEDPEALRYINDRYYSRHPIDMMKI